MRITAAAWTRYVKALRLINDRAAQDMRLYLETRGLPSTDAEEDALIDTAYAIAAKYGAASAALSARMYDATAALAGRVLPAALPAEVPTIHEVAKAVVGTAKSGNPEIVASAVGRLVKQTGVDTTMHNAIRDNAEWAWIPQGETCAFCITLASNGWQRASRKALQGGHAEHIHANCDCTYAIRWDSSSSVAGYDPAKYKRMYDEAAPGRNSETKINAMRRELYAQNKEEINAQKRDAYAKQQERESSAAEEMDV